eukprot:bmy_20517T0
MKHRGRRFRTARPTAKADAPWALALLLWYLKPKLLLPAQPGPPAAAGDGPAGLAQHLEVD